MSPSTENLNAASNSSSSSENQQAVVTSSSDTQCESADSTTKDPEVPEVRKGYKVSVELIIQLQLSSFFCAAFHFLGSY